MKVQADKKRTERHFTMDDWVYIKFHPYRQLPMRGDNYSKLSPKFFGLFRVVIKVGQVAYQLELLANAKIHHTFHVSQQKRKIGDKLVVPHLSVSLSINGHILLEPERVVDRRIIKKNHRPITQVLIKWFNCAEADNSWLHLQDL